MNVSLIRTIGLLSALLVAGCATSGEQTGSVQAKAPGYLEVCHGQECYFRSKLHLSSGDHRRFAAIMSRGRASAKAERQAISSAVQYFEKRSTALLGKRDRPMTQFGNSQRKGEMDCIDEGTNTDTLLRYLAARGLLKHHSVERVRSRGFILDNQFPHVAATVREKGGQLWAIDSWVRAGGEAPDIKPFDQWKRGGDLSAELAAAMQ